IGVTAVLHTWGQNLDHHPHVHCIVPGGGVSGDGGRWVRCRPNFFLPVRVLSRLFRRLFLEGLEALHAAGQLQFFNELSGLEDEAAFRAYLAPLRKSEWVVYAKRPFAGPAQVLAYLARYTHRVAIGNSRLLDLDDTHVSFRWKDYREHARRKSKVMRLNVGEFKRDPKLKLAFSGGIGIMYLDFLDCGIPSRRGPTSVCGWPPAWRSTARRSAIPRPWAHRRRPATSCPRASSMRCR